MLQNILNLDGVAQLNKKEQRSINGGGYCVLTLGNGDSILLLGVSDDQEASGDANDACVDEIINSGAGSCSYDCSYDGFGQ